MPVSAKARELVAEAVRWIENFEHARRLRKLARSARNQASFEATVTAVICDLVVHALSGHAGRVAITLSNQQLSRKSRYRPPALNEGLRNVLDVMARPELALVDMVKGWHDLDPRPYRERYRQTTIIAGPVLRSWIERENLSLTDCGRDEAEEVILLKGMKPKRGEEAPSYVEPRAPLIEYDDNSPDHPSRRVRADMRRINSWIAPADLALAEPIPGVDASQRRLRRHFTQGSFESGGRLFGGFWQNIRRELRSRLRINGEPVVTLDYQAMFINLAYARMGVQPVGDPYMIPGWEAYRPGVKKVMAATLFHYRPTGRVPQGTRKLLSAGAPLEVLMHAIMGHHRPIRDFLCFDFGHSLMFDESEIMVAALLCLRDHGVVGLPLHDALCVAASDREPARRVMVEVYRDRTGQTIEVSEVTGSYDGGGSSASEIPLPQCSS